MLYLIALLVITFGLLILRNQKNNMATLLDAINEIKSDVAVLATDVATLATDQKATSDLVTKVGVDLDAFIASHSGGESVTAQELQDLADSSAGIKAASAAIESTNTALETAAAALTAIDAKELPAT